MTGRKSLDEFGLIARYLAPLARGASGAFGLLDDAAILDIPAAQRLVVTMDALIEGVHFFSGDPPDQIGRKLLRVNLSDLAAMGATPFAYLLTMALHDEGTAGWVESFARGLQVDQELFSVSLVGGDTTSTRGPIALSVTALGHVSTEGGLRRSGASAGDRIYVSGSIGDGALGLRVLTGGLPFLAEDDRAYLENRFRLPDPRVALGRRLLGLASSAIDVSDGLAGDLGHICVASGLAATVEVDRVPLSLAARRAVENDPDIWNFVLGGGDDYELLFTLSPNRGHEIETVANELGVPVTQIGLMQNGQGVSLLGPGGQEISLKQQGYRHF